MSFKWLPRLSRRTAKILFVVIVVVAFLTRVYNLAYPSAYYFDEVYHAMTAKLIARNDPRAFEWTHGDTIEPHTYVEWLHPPVAKYTQALSIRVFGENAFGWRFSSALFGTAVIAMTMMLADRLFKNKYVTLLSGFLALLDGLLLAQSRIAMNDIHLVFGYLVTMFVYIWYRQAPSLRRLGLVGLAAGLTVATKWSGVFVLVSMMLVEIFSLGWTSLQHWLQLPKQRTQIIWRFFTQATLRLLLLVALPLAVYVSSYGLMFAQGKSFDHFIQLHRQIFWYQFNLEATHPYQSRPLDWVFVIRPVWYFVEYLPNSRRADIYNTSNPLISYLGGSAAVATLGLIGWHFYQTNFKARHGKRKLSHVKALEMGLEPIPKPPEPMFALAMLLLTYCLAWIPWLFSPRIMFYYHYAPAIPLLSIMLAYWLVRLWRADRRLKPLVILVLSAAVLFFIIWYPHWVAIPMSTSLKDSLYFAIPSWR